MRPIVRSFARKLETLDDGFLATRDLSRASESLWMAPSRIDVAATTASIAAAASSSHTLILGKTYRLLKAVASADARIRLYGSAAGAAADIARAFGAAIPAAVLCHYDAQYTAAATSLTQSPMVHGANLEATVLPNIYLTINNIAGAPAVITVTLTVETLEWL